MGDAPRGVIVIVLDSLRADHVLAASAPPTPNIAELSSRATIFERAVAPAAWTLPSHVSILTGMSPTEHGIQSKGSVRESLLGARSGVEELASSGRYLPAWLQSSGVHTFLGSSIGWLSPASGLSRGFGSVAFVPFPPGRRRQAQPPRDGAPIRERVRTSTRRVPIPLKHAVRTGLEVLKEGRRAIPMARWVLSREDKGATRLDAALGSWLSSVDGPFFALLNLIETHDPHIAPRGYGRRDLRSILKAVGVKRFTRRTNLHNWGYAQLARPEVERMRRAYRAEATYADECVGRILAGLKVRGLDETTTVIVTADHGEGFGEHGLVGHGMPLTQSVLHVPLVVARPRQDAERVTEPVGLSSIAASVAVEITGEAGPFGVPSLIRNEGRGRARAEVEAPGRYFHSSGLKLREIPAQMERPAAAFYEGNMKLIVGSFWGEALYDLDADPTESTDLSRERDIPPGLLEMRSEWEQRVLSR